MRANSIDIPKLKFGTFDPGSGTSVESGNNQDYIVSGSLAALVEKGYDITRVNPAVAAVAITHPKELELRIWADALGDVQKRNVQKIDDEIVGSLTVHAVRDTRAHFYDKSMRFATRIALIAGLLFGVSTAAASVESHQKPNSGIEITSGDVAIGASVGVIGGLLTSMVTVGTLTGGRSIRRRARRELRKQLSDTSS